MLEDDSAPQVVCRPATHPRGVLGYEAHLGENGQVESYLLFWKGRGEVLLVGEVKKERRVLTRIYSAVNVLMVRGRELKALKKGVLQRNCETVCICVEACAYPPRNETYGGFV